MRSRLAIVCVATVVVATGCQSVLKVPKNWTGLPDTDQADETTQFSRQVSEVLPAIAARHTYACRLEWYEKTSVTAGGVVEGSGRDRWVELCAIDKAFEDMEQNGPEPGSAGSSEEADDTKTTKTAAIAAERLERKVK